MQCIDIVQAIFSKLVGFYYMKGGEMTEEHEDVFEEVDIFLEDEQDEENESLLSHEEDKAGSDDLDSPEGVESVFEEIWDEEKHPLITPEEDQELRDTYGIDEGMEGCKPALGRYDLDRIKRGLETYEDYQRRAYHLKRQFYEEDKSMLKNKRRFRRSMDYAIGGIDNLGEISAQYDDLLENLFDPDMIDEKEKIRKLLKSVPKNDARKIIDKLLEDEKVSSEQHEYLIDNFLDERR